MKFSISILLMLTSLVALEISLFMRRVSEPVLIVAGLTVFLIWCRLTEALKSEARELKSWIQDAVLTCVCLFGCGVPLYRMLFPPPPPETWDSTHSVSVDLVLVLTALLLANGFVTVPNRKGGRSKQVLMIGLYLVLAFLFLTIAMGPGLWLVYIATKGIEMGRFDPYQILEAPEVLSFSEAFLKALFGLLGFALWTLLAALTYFRMKRKPEGCYTRIWLVSVTGCFATTLQWKFLLDDFPLLWEAIDAILYQNRFFNAILLGILGVATYYQYCAGDQAEDQSSAAEPRTPWRNRLLGIALVAPAVWKLSELSWRFCRMFLAEGLSFFDSLGWLFMLVDLLELESIMLFALFLIGIRALVSAKTERVRLRSLPPTAVVQLLLIAVLLVIFVPIHLAASQFYFDAAIALP